MSDEFVDAYALTTGLKHRIPRDWLDDPVLGRPFAKTPSQRELDGELPARPAGDATAKDIDAFAAAADIDLSGIKKNADKLEVIEQAMGPAPVQEGVIAVEPAPVAADPLAPELVAHVDGPPAITSTDDTGSSDETPAAGDEEN